MKYNYYNRYSKFTKTEPDIGPPKIPTMYIPAKRSVQTVDRFNNNPDQNNQRMDDMKLRPPGNENINERDNQPQDFGPEPFVSEIERETIRNNNFRAALWTGEKLQITLMSLLPGEDIGFEVHPDTDQVIKIEEGFGLVEMGDNRNNLNFRRRVTDDDIVVIPAGKWHNLTNIGQSPLKLYSIYAPPEHPAGTVYRTKAQEEEQHAGEPRQDQMRQPQNQTQPPQQPPMTPGTPMAPQPPMTQQPPMVQPPMTPAPCATAADDTTASDGPAPMTPGTSPPAADDTTLLVQPPMTPERLLCRAADAENIPPRIPALDFSACRCPSTLSPGAVASPGQFPRHRSTAYR